MRTFNIPSHYDANKADQVFRVEYQTLAASATAYKKAENISNAATDKYKIALMPIDMQNTFCIPGFELFVPGAVEDTQRLSEFIYRNLGRITKIYPTMDTHTLMQIFHSLFFIDVNGETVPAYTSISSQDLKNNKYTLNPAVAASLGVDYLELKKHVLFYTEELEKKGKYQLTVWPYHGILGGIGHALVSLFEEAVRFHSFVRNAEAGTEIKGGNPLTENYSVLSPEVLSTHNGTAIAQKNASFIEKLLNYDIVIISGEAKSHCLAFSVDDFLTEIQAKDPALAEKVYLLEDCTSPIGGFEDQANHNFDRFKQAGMHIVKSTTPMDQWPGVNVNKLQ